MKTVGFDTVVEINESLVNRALAAAFYTTTIPHTIDGTYTPPNVPPELLPYAKIEYKIRLKEPPTVDAFTGNIVRILFNIEAILTVLGGLVLEFDVASSVEASPTYDQAARKLTIDLKAARLVKVDFQDTYGLSQEVLQRLNSAIAAVVRSGILDQVETVDIAPVLYSIDLPDMPLGPDNQLTVGLGNIKILNRSVLAVCINLLGYTGGDINRLSDFSGGLDLCGGVSEAAMHRVFDFWWERTTHPKSISNEGRYDIPVLPNVLDALTDVGVDVTSALATMGLYIADVDVIGSWIDYRTSVRFGKPKFDLKRGNLIEVSDLDLYIDLEVKLTFRIRARHRLFWGLWTISEAVYDVTLPPFSIRNQHVVVEKVLANIYLDSQNRIMAKLQKIDLEIDLRWNLPEQILNWIIDKLEEIISDNIPPLPLSPALITQKIPGTELTLQIDIDRLTTDEDEAIIGANIAFQQVGRTAIPVPKFLANRDPQSMEVHRADCAQLDAVLEKNKVGYYVLMDALKDGYRGCKDCLPEYQR